MAVDTPTVLRGREARELIRTLAADCPQSFREIAERLNREGYVRPSGKPWDRVAVYYAADPIVRADITSREQAEEYLPSPAEIEAACSRIQAEWSPSERRRRACGANQVAA